MKIQCLLTFLILFCFSSVVNAAFLKAVPQTYNQPDGFVLECLASGDEYYHWLHDKNNFTIIHNPENGFFVYADLVDGELRPTRWIPGRDDPQSAGLTAGLNISPEKYRELRREREAPQGMKTASNGSNIGTLNNIVIFIRFADQSEYTTTTNYYTQAFNGTNMVSMKEYYHEVSNNQLEINTKMYPTPSGTTVISFQDSHSRRYYQPYSVTNPDGYRTSSESTNREMTLLKNTVDGVRGEIEAQGLDHDMNDDGYVDNVCFVVQGRTDGWSDLLWPHMWVLYTMDVQLAGARVWTFNFQLSDALGVSVLCHEMFHSLGAPDLYRYENRDLTPIGIWDLMAHNQSPPQHMSAYMKMKYGGWVNDIPTITSAGNYSLTPLSSSPFAAYKIRSPNSTSEFFILEYRKATGRFESSLPGSGMVIYRVNSSLEGNADGPPDEIYVYRPNGTTRSDGSINSAYFSANAGRTTFNDNSNPSCFLSTGADGGIQIYDISTAESVISFKVGTNDPYKPPKNLTLTLSNRTANLTWEQPENSGTNPSGYKIFRNQMMIHQITGYTQTDYSDPSLANGTYQYYVTATYSNPNGESAGSNTVSVEVSDQSTPDLIITNAIVSPSNVQPGGVVDLACKVKNVGNAPAGASMTRFYLSVDNLYDASDLQLSNTSVGALDPDGNQELVENNLNIPGSIGMGTWYVLFVADADGGVSESIETNNTTPVELRIGAIEINPPRDLNASVSGLDVILTWQEPIDRGGILSAFKVFRNNTLIHTLNDTSVKTYTDASLAIGTYTYHVTARYSSPEGESVRSNEVAVTVDPNAKPDLTIQDFQVTPSSLTAGGTIDISCNLLNIGGAEAGTSEIRVYLSQDETYDNNDYYLAYGTLNPIPQGESILITGEDISIPSDIAFGNWYALLIADAQQEIEESNEDNNQAQETINIQGEAPDLQFTYLNLFPKVIARGSNVRISSNIYNSGPVSAFFVNANFYVSKDDVLDTGDLMVSQTSTRFLSGKSNFLAYGGFILSWNTTPGQYYLIAVVDRDNTIKESNDTNNQIILAFNVAGTTSVDPLETKLSLQVYPIPARYTLHLYWESLPDPEMELSIIDIYGREVFKTTPALLEQEMEVDVSLWESGVYFIRWQTDGKQFIKKVLIK